MAARPTTFFDAVSRRSSFGGGDGEESACHSYDDYTAEPIVGDHTFHDIMIYTSLVTTVLCCLIILGLCLGHAFNYREPLVQKQLIRIMLTPAMFAIFSFFSVWSYRYTDYLSPIPALYEAFAFISVFFLMINYLVPSGKFADQIAYFSTRSYGKKQKPGYESFRNWYILIFQFLPIRLATTITSEILTVVTCVGDREYKRAQTAVSIINAVTGLAAIVGLFGFLRRLYSTAKLRDSKLIGKLVPFKLIVLLGLVQGLVLRVMAQTSALEPISTLSYNDLNLGLEPFLLCCEAFLLSCGMLYFYDPRLHGTSSVGVVVGRPGSSMKYEGLALEEGLNGKAVNPRMGVARALLDIVNIWDVIKGFSQALWLVRHWKSASR